jgi:hypothetical protein
MLLNSKIQYFEFLHAFFSKKKQRDIWNRMILNRVLAPPILMLVLSSAKPSVAHRCASRVALGWGALQPSVFARTAASVCGLRQCCLGFFLARARVHKYLNRLLHDEFGAPQGRGLKGRRCSTGGRRHWASQSHAALCRGKVFLPFRFAAITVSFSCNSFVHTWRTRYQMH